MEALSAVGRAYATAFGIHPDTHDLELRLSRATDASNRAERRLFDAEKSYFVALAEVEEAIDRYRRTRRRWWALIGAITLALFVVITRPARADCPSYAPTLTGTAAAAQSAACDAVAQCARDLRAEPVPAEISNVPPEALPFATAAYRAQRCAWAADVRARENAAALAVLRPIPQCPAAVVECPVCEPCGVTFVEGLACFGAMSITGIVTGAVGVARCGQ